MVILTAAALNAFFLPDMVQPNLKDNPKPFRGHYFLGLAHLGNKDVQRAKAELDEVVKLNPNWIEARLTLADLHLRTGAVILQSKRSGRCSNGIPNPFRPISSSEMPIL